MATMNVSLPDPMKVWAEERVASGRYANVSDYVRDLIRRDRADQEQLEALRAALIEGEASGVDPRSVDEIFADVLRGAPPPRG